MEWWCPCSHADKVPSPLRGGDRGGGGGWQCLFSPPPQLGDPVTMAGGLCGHSQSLLLRMHCVSSRVVFLGFVSPGGILLFCIGFFDALAVLFKQGALNR